MSGFAQAASTAARQLAQVGAPFALVGGFAVSIRTEPRFTRDLDLVVAVDGDDRAEAVLRSFLEVGYAMSSEVTRETDGRLAIAQLEDLDHHPLDLLFASSGIEAEVAADAELLEVLPGLSLPVATVGHLVALKLLSVDDRHRPQDRVDLLALRRVSSDRDAIDAHRAVELITARGYDRGRDLVAAVEQFSSPTP